MQQITLAKVCESDLATLFGKGTPVIRAWVRAGMARNHDGSFSLVAVLRWREKQHTAERLSTLAPDRLSQPQLAALFDVTRQSVTAWGRSGLPRNTDGSYNLKEVCQWLRSYYAACAERKYQTSIGTLKRKLARNVRQLERFFERENKII